MGATATMEQAVDVGGRWRSSRFPQAERERGRGGWAEGANERGEVGEQGAELKRGAGGSNVAGECAVVGASTTGDRGREVRDG
jgi:hypothetical protein